MNKKRIKVVSIEDRIPKLKQERKKKANRRLVFYLSLFFMLISIIVYLQSPLSNIKKIVVTGTSYYTKEEIITKSQLTNKTNIWMLDKKRVESMINENPIIKSVEVDRNFPSTVRIKITEHVHVGHVKRDDSIYPVFGNGIILSETTKTLGSAPLMLSFNEEVFLDEMIDELVKVPQSMLNLISEIHWKPEKGNKKRIILYMNDGFVVDGSIKKFSEKIQVYPSIAAQLDADSQGVIHIGAGAYFEEFNLPTESNGKEHETEG